MFKHKDNPEILLLVHSRYNVWTVIEVGGQRDRDPLCILHSAAAGDMNPASQRNNHCKKCGEGSEEMSSWAYVTGDMLCYGKNSTSIESDKIKVFCENDEIHSLEETTNEDDITDLDTSKNSEETSGLVDQSRDSDESSGEWNNIS